MARLIFKTSMCKAHAVYISIFTIIVFVDKCHKAMFSIFFLEKKNIYIVFVSKMFITEKFN